MTFRGAAYGASKQWGSGRQWLRHGMIHKGNSTMEDRDQIKISFGPV